MVKSCKVFKKPQTSKHGQVYKFSKFAVNIPKKLPIQKDQPIHIEGDMIRWPWTVKPLALSISVKTTKVTFSSWWR